MISLRGVSKSYGQSRALEGIDLTIPSGQTTVLLGPSGCGKSTLLRVVVGLVRPDQGEVRIGGDVLRPENTIRIRRSVGYVIQEGGLFPHLDARANVSLMAKVLEWPKERIRQRVLELAELAHLSPSLLTRFPAELSGGQRQRVSLMRALMLDPELLLLDEPLGALDPIVRRELQEELKAIFRHLDKTVLLVTHDLGEAGFFGDEIVMMNAGRIVQRGPLRDLINHPEDPFVTRFVNSQRLPWERLAA